MNNTAKCPSCSGCARLVGDDFECARCGETWTAPASARPAALPTRVEIVRHVATEPGVPTVACPVGTLEAQREASKRFYPTQDERKGYVVCVKDASNPKKALSRINFSI